MTGHSKILFFVGLPHQYKTFLLYNIHGPLNACYLDLKFHNCVSFLMKNPKNLSNMQKGDTL